MKKFYLEADDVRRMIAKAWENLELQRERINNLNVFPVPDGDTGTNIWFTLKPVVEVLNHQTRISISELSQILTRETLLNARGNSGVILSQFLAGCCRVIGSYEEIDLRTFERALSEGVEQAYRSLTNPVEGTILTVMRAAADAARSLGSDLDFVSGLQRVHKAAGQALEETPELLKVLSDAGVVDAGGQGFVYLLEGALCGLAGKRLRHPRPIQATISGVVRTWDGLLGSLRQSSFTGQEGIGMKRARRQLSLVIGEGIRQVGLELPLGQLARALSEVQGMLRKREPKTVEELISTGERVVEAWHKRPQYRYCVEFLLQGQSLPLSSIKEALAPHGNCLMVVGREDLARVHIHTNEPQKVRELGQGFGVISRYKADDIYRQHDELLSPDGLKPGIGVVAVVQGKGNARVFERLGARPMGYKGAAPSVEELIREIEALGLREVLVLPNDPNVRLSAEEASRLVVPRVAVIPSRTMPEGISALLDFNSEDSFDLNRDRMCAALTRVRSAAVARAIRPVQQGKLEIRKGDFIGIVEDEIRVKGKDLEAVAMELLRGLITQESVLVSIYYGRDTRPARARSLSDRVRVEFPRLEVQLYEGGQPHYYYYLSVE